MRPKLEVMISTMGAEGLKRVSEMRLPQVDGVAYLVSCQGIGQQVPAPLYRDDIRVIFTDTTGLSNNRNNCIANLRAPYAIIADDDLNYYEDGLKSLLARIESNPDVDIFTFVFDFPYPRCYPPVEQPLTVKHKGYHPISIEIGFRTDWVKSHGMGFSPMLGIGAPYLTCGEEDLFVYRAKKEGANTRFFPITVGAHPNVPTLRRDVKAPGALRAGGAIVVLTYPFTSVARLLLKAKRERGPMLRNLFYLTQGAAYALRHRGRLLSNFTKRPL